MKGYHIKDVMSELVLKTPTTVGEGTFSGSDPTRFRQTSQLNELGYSMEILILFYLLQDMLGG